jgi:sucrose synthase
MIFSIAILSPHGWFGQSNVLGRPDTGGQVVYILDQVRALERRCAAPRRAGLDIEPQILVLTRLIPEAEGTSATSAWSPSPAPATPASCACPSARRRRGRAALDLALRDLALPGALRRSTPSASCSPSSAGGPDLIIGNYSDGNLVASLLAQRLGVTQCNIAHALEKTKYLFSDLYWRDNEEQHHFSCQFTADLIAMNTRGLHHHQHLPGDRRHRRQRRPVRELHGLHPARPLPRVAGIDVYDPKFNIVSPGRRRGHLLPAAPRRRAAADHLHPRSRS